MPMSDPAGANPMAVRARRAVLALGAVLVVYYAAPVGELPSTVSIVLSVLGLVAGLGVLVWMALRQVRRLVASDPSDESVRIEGLLLIVYVAVPIFALGYFALEEAAGDQFAGLSTKTDALYFTVSTLATVGFGDVHATGQLARVLVTAQIVFNLVFIGTLVSLLTRVIHERGTVRRAMAERAREREEG